jgi:hypothetical protein
MAASVVDYAWFRYYHGGLLYDKYSLTLVEGISPDKFLQRIGAESQGLLTGFGALTDHRVNSHTQQEAYGDLMYLGATTVTGKGGGHWTLVVEHDGVLSVDYPLMGQASIMTWAISHHTDGTGRRFFCWWDGGDMTTWFEQPNLRPGSAPPVLLEAIDRVGVTGDPEIRVAEYFALAEELTGVRVTADLLDNAVYTTAVVARSQEQDAADQRRQAVGPMSHERELAIRVWARSRGMKVADHGPIPEIIVDLYAGCH